MHENQKHVRTCVGFSCFRHFNPTRYQFFKFITKFLIEKYFTLKNKRLVHKNRTYGTCIRIANVTEIISKIP
jgi:hypothetical protein